MQTYMATKTGKTITFKPGLVTCGRDGEECFLPDVGEMPLHYYNLSTLQIKQNFKYYNEKCLLLKRMKGKQQE